MAHQHPSWLDEKFMAAALQGGEDKEPKVKVLNFHCSPAVPLGENYQSRLHKLHVEYSSSGSAKQSVFLLVKSPLTQGFVANVQGFHDPFAKEQIIYNELLPKIDKKINYQFGPRSFYSPLKSVLVLQDLKEDGYIMCDRTKQLNFEYCAQVMKTIAKFHATSVFIQHEEPKFVESISQESMYRDDSPIGGFVKMMIVPVLTMVGNMLNNIEGCDKYANLIFKKMEHVWSSAVERFKPKIKGLNVLTHGDLWINNILFKHDESGELIGVKFIDYPVVRYTSPATDLAYFIWSSANGEVRENKLDELCEIYLEALNSTLEQLGCEERLTMEELKEDLKSLKDWLLFLICQFVPMVLSNPTDAIDVSELSEDVLDPSNYQAMFIKVIQGKTFQSALPTIMRQYEAWLS
uniref:CHK kinase-like domain-containing protein n=1 Tax=Cuerna arida TaxID=1464854 RepID=A0A1B6FI19_9HEMI